MLGSCERYSFEECVKIHGLDSGSNATEDEMDAKLLCEMKGQVVFELVSAAAVAIVAYLISKCAKTRQQRQGMKPFCRTSSSLATLCHPMTIRFTQPTFTSRLPSARSC